MTTLTFELGPRPDYREEAARIIAAAESGKVPVVSNWELIQALVSLLQEQGRDDTTFRRSESSRTVNYNMEEMAIAIERTIECRG